MADFQRWRVDHAADPGTGIEFARRLVVASVVDEGGEVVLTPDDVNDMDAATLAELAEHIGRVNGIAD